MTEEVLRGWETQLFQTDSYQLLFFFCREERQEWLARTHIFRHTQQKEMLWEGSWDGVTIRRLLYCLHSVLNYGPHLKCAVQTTPDKCSVWLLAAETNHDPIFHSFT